MQIEKYSHHNFSIGNHGRDSISVITACYNDFPAFTVTLDSLKSELMECDELVVVDSSLISENMRNILANEKLHFHVKYIWVNPTGVYPAQNAGIRKSTRAWLQVVNSGDMLLSGGRLLISEAIREHPGTSIHVFSQQSGFKGVATTLFTPSHSSVWPHQSIIAAREVYDYLGFYNERYKIVADQIFFSHARKLFRWRIHKNALTYYDLAGVSSTISCSKSQEFYAMWRTLGISQIVSIIRAYLIPWFRTVLQYVFGVEIIGRIKRKLFSHYK